MSNDLIPLALATLAGDAHVDLPEQWKDEASGNFEFSLRSRSGFAQRYFDAAEKLKVLRPLLDHPLALLILPSVKALPFATDEEKDSVFKEAKIVEDYWGGK